MPHAEAHGPKYILIRHDGRVLYSSASMTEQRLGCCLTAVTGPSEEAFSGACAAHAWCNLGE